MLSKDLFFKFQSFIRKYIPLIIAFFFWIVISALLVAFVNALFQSTQDEIVEKEKIIILFIIIFSISVSAFIIFYIVNLFLAINRKEFGARMKLKITIFFIFIAILPIIPFIQIGTKFISSSMNLWFSKNFGFALDLSEEIIKTYYNEKRAYLSNFTDEINWHIKNNGLTYQKLIDILPDAIEEKKINSLSIWDKNGQLLKQIGDEVFEIEKKNRFFSDKRIYLTKNEENIFNMETKKGLLYLVIPAKVFDVENNLLGFINFGIIIHPKFNKSITEIEDSLRNYNTANLYKDFFTRGFVSLFLIIIFPIILVILIISLFLSKDILDPIESLSKATKRVAEGDLNFQVGHSFNDEFMTLSQSFNRMINELDVSRTMLKQKEKIATWQDIAKQLAHEIKNPLTPIKLSVERLLKKYEDNSPNFPETIDKCSKTILKEVSNIDKLLNEFANFSEIIIFDKKPDEIFSIICEVIENLKDNEKSIRINTIPTAKEYPILRDRGQLKRAFFYVLNFIIEISSEKDTIDIFTDIKTVGFKKYIVIVFKNGKDTKRSEFISYFGANKNEKKLDLLIAEQIISEHDGRIYNLTTNDNNNLIIELPIYEKD